MADDNGDRIAKRATAGAEGMIGKIHGWLDQFGVPKATVLIPEQTARWANEQAKAICSHVASYNPGIDADTFRKLVIKTLAEVFNKGSQARDAADSERDA